MRRARSYAFKMLDGRPETLQAHAEQVEEMALDLGKVRHVFALSR